MAWFAEKKDLVLTPLSLIAALLATLKAQRIAWRGFVAERFTHAGWGFWRDPEAVSKAKERLATFTLAWLAALTFKALNSPPAVDDRPDFAGLHRVHVGAAHAQLEAP